MSFKIYNYNFAKDNDGELSRVYEQLDDVYWNIRVMFGRKPFQLPHHNVVPLVIKMFEKQKGLTMGHFPIQSHKLDYSISNNHKIYANRVFDQQIDDIQSVYCEFFRDSTPTDNNTYDYLKNNEQYTRVLLAMHTVYDVRFTGTQMAIKLYQECKPTGLEENYILWIAIVIILLVKRSSFPSNKI